MLIGGKAVVVGCKLTELVLRREYGITALIMLSKMDVKRRVQAYHDRQPVIPSFRLRVRKHYRDRSAIAVRVAQ